MDVPPSTPTGPEVESENQSAQSLRGKLQPLGAREAAEAIARVDAALASETLAGMLATTTQGIFKHLDPEVKSRILNASPPELVKQWALEKQYPQNSIGRLMEVPVGIFTAEQTVGEVTEILRDLVKRHLITYGFIVDAEHRLEGVITMRDLLFNEKSVTLGEIMLKEVFTLQGKMDLIEAMKLTVDRHYPVYPVTDDEGVLLGLIRGASIFQAQAFELSAQAGSMVGVEKEERLSTPWKRSLFLRHPWLQLNLLTAFAAAAVVGVFEDTIAQVVALAVFLPVLAGQSGNTGCQALAVALRALTLGELTEGKTKLAVTKEALLGLCNGVLVGITAGLGMYIFAAWQQNEMALMLALVVFLAMVGSCLVSGIAGALIPVILRRLGADPATASSIFLTTATDVVSMGLFLGLATILVL